MLEAEGEHKDQFRHCKLYCSRMPKGSVVLLYVCVPFTRRQLMFVHAGNCCEPDSISSAKNWNVARSFIFDRSHIAPKGLAEAECCWPHLVSNRVCDVWVRLMSLLSVNVQQMTKTKMQHAEFSI